MDPSKEPIGREKSDALVDQIAKKLLRRLRQALIKSEPEIIENEPDIIVRGPRHTGGPAADGSLQSDSRARKAKIAAKRKLARHTGGPAADGSLQSESGAELIDERKPLKHTGGPAADGSLQHSMFD